MTAACTAISGDLLLVRRHHKQSEMLHWTQHVTTS